MRPALKIIPPDAQPAPVPEHEWRCRKCGWLLARVLAGPGGVVVLELVYKTFAARVTTLPGTLADVTCPRCTQANAFKAEG